MRNASAKSPHPLQCGTVPTRVCVYHLELRGCFCRYFDYDKFKEAKKALDAEIKQTRLGYDEDEGM